MISHHHETIFVHIPKVAGKSIEHAFLNSLGLTWETRKPLLLMPNDRPEIGPARLAHLKACEYVKYHYISQKLFNSYFKFSFVRNPWSRVVSFHKYLYLNRGISFEKFVMEILQKKIDEDYFFFFPQIDYVTNENGKIIVDYIGRFESLQEDFNKIKNDCNLKSSTLEHINKSEKNNSNKSIEIRIKRLLKPLLGYNYNQPEYKNYQQYYKTNELYDTVMNIYNKDIEQFSYKF